MPDPDLLATDDGKTRYASYFSTLETECGHWRRMILSIVPCKHQRLHARNRFDHSEHIERRLVDTPEIVIT